jgi:hypothetical protein
MTYRLFPLLLRTIDTIRASWLLTALWYGVVLCALWWLSMWFYAMWSLML